MLDRVGAISNYKLRIEAGNRSKLQGDELEILIDGFIEKLAGLRLSAEIEEACQSEIRLLELGYSKNTISKNHFPRYRAAIAEAYSSGRLPNSNAHAHDVTYNPKDGDLITERQHRAYGQFKYAPEFYIQQRQGSAAINNRQQDNRKPIVGELIIDKAQLYLNDKDPYCQAAAIAALTGRRVTEVLAKGTFDTTDHPYALLFKGQQKAKGTPVFIIPTLIPAQEVLDAFRVFKKKPQIKELRGLDASSIKGRIGSRVNNRVRRIFGEDNKSGALIPIIEGRASTTIHVLRGVYAALACVYLKPVQQDDDRFIQAILGHCTGKDTKREANSPALQHYKHYYVVDRQSKPLMTDDSILKEHGALPDISPEYIKPDGATEPEKTMEQPAESVQGTIDMSQFMDQIATMAAQKLAQPKEATGEAEQLQKQVDTLQAKNEALEAQNKALTAQLELLQTQLSQVGQILNMSAMGLGAAPQNSPTPETVEPAVEVETPAPQKPKKAEGPSDVEKRIDVLFELAQLYCQEFQPIDLSQSLIERIGVSRGNVKAWLSRNHDEVQAYRDRFGITGKRFNRNAGIDVEQFVQWIRQKEQAGKDES